VKFRRGDIVIASASGDYGKPRPCLVVQSSLFADLNSVTFCQMTSDLQFDEPLLRIKLQPTPQNGLEKPSAIAIDKLIKLHQDRVAKKIGEADDVTMQQVTRALAAFLEIG
jgi:mRNA interferase MazF